MGGTFYRSTSYRGASGYQYLSVGWPYSSNYADISQKVVLKIRGGVTCCNAYDNFYLDDNITSAYTELWTDKTANITVYRTPTRNSGTSTNMQILNVVNPFPIQKETYEQIKEIELIFYSGYKNTHIKQITQFAYSSYSQLSEVSIGNAGTSNPVDTTRSFKNHQYYATHFDLSYSFSRNSFSGRSLSHSVIKFTSGARLIEEAYIRYTASPYLVNPVLSVTIFKDVSDNKWCLKVSGMDDNAYNTGQNWIIRIRYFPTNWNLAYTSTTYAANGEVEFSNTASFNVNAFYSGGVAPPTTFEIPEQRYTSGYYEMQRKPIYAASGSTTNRLAFRFTTPYDISEVESFTVALNTVNELIPSNTPNSLTCIFQNTVTQATSYGAGLLSACTYSSGVYTINAPIGGLAIG